jgi:3-oxosteroid 1-dehydrogenase
MSSTLPKTSEFPKKWDLETDLVAVGSGAAGLAAAITGHDHGASAVVLERSSQVGGVTAYSFGQVWIAGNHHAAALGIADSVENGYRYIKHLGMGFADDVALLNLVVHAPLALRYFEQKIDLRMRVVRKLPDYYWPQPNSVAEGRYLEVLPFAANTLGEWQRKTRVSPLVPYGLTHVDIFGNGGPAKILQWDFRVMAERLEKDLRCLGPGLACYFVKGALDRGIPLLTDTAVEELICDGHRIVGIRAKTAQGDFYVRANRGVVLASGAYEHNSEYVRTLGQQIDLKSMLMDTVDGAALRLAGKMGARIARVPDLTMLGYHIPGEEQEGDQPLWRNAMTDLGLPHTLVANRAGRRFADEAFYRSICYAVDYIDGARQVHPNFPCWAIFDSQARAKYPFGAVMPGQDLPEGLGITANTLEELATRAGIDPRGLQHTIAAFNGFCERGADPDFGRGTSPWAAFMSGDPDNKPNVNLGPVSKPPFYAVQLHRLGGGGISAAGLVCDEHCRVMGWDDRPIEGLYAGGNSAARLDSGAAMQSGLSNARGLTHGYLIGQHVAGRPSGLLAGEQHRLGL